MIINKYPYNKENLGITVKQLKKNYEEGWEALNFVVGYDNQIWLSDDVYNNEGFFRFGFQDYLKVVQQLNSRDVQKITDLIHHNVQNNGMMGFRNRFLIQTVDYLRRSETYKYAVNGDKVFKTVDELEKYYRPNYDLELVFSDGVREYLYIQENVIKSEHTYDYDVSKHEDIDLKVQIRYRGNSMVVYGWIGDKITHEDTFTVDSAGGTKGSVRVFYEAIYHKNRRELLDDKLVRKT